MKKVYVGMDETGEIYIFKNKPVENEIGGEFKGWMDGAEGDSVSWIRGSLDDFTFGLKLGQYRELNFGQVYETDLPVEGR